MSVRGRAVRLRLVLAALAGSASFLAATATPASAYSVQVFTFPSGITQTLVSGSAANDTITAEDLGDRRMRFTGSDPATVGTGCTASGNSATCELGNSNAVFINSSGGADDVEVASAPVPVSVSGGEADDELAINRPGDSGSPLRFPAEFSGGPGDDILIGSAARDSMEGGTNDDVLVGNAGDDRLLGGFGGDEVSGGAGVDEGSYLLNANSVAFGAPRTVGITVHVGDGVCNDGSAQDDAVGSRPQLPRGITSTCGAGNAVERDEIQGDVETIVGTDGADNIIGAAGDGTITGLASSDTLEGAGGVDFLLGEGTRRTIPGEPPPPADGDDLLLLRDNLADGSSSCGAAAGDRAVSDQSDPVNPDCETVERGAAGATGPATNGPAFSPGTTGGTPEPGSPGEDAQPIEPPPAPPPDTPPTGNDTGGGGPGGGDNGKTPPDLQIFGDTLLIDSKRRAQARITCVYLAKECEGTAELVAAKNVGRGRKAVEKGDRVGDADISIPWGRTGKVPIRVTKALVNALGDDSTKLKLVVEARDSGAGADAAVARAARKMTTELQG